MSAQKTTEEEKRQLILREQAARASAEAKDEFLAVVSHELRTPLTAILLWAKLLKSGHVSPNQQEMALNAIEQSAAAQEQLVEDLLDISRLVSGRLRLEVRETDVRALIQEAIETIRPAAELKGVHLETSLNPQVGEVRIDPDRLRQVVWNLVHNAVKFTPAAGRVTVSLQRDSDMVRIEVKDTGQGISADFLPHVFERFLQADLGPTRVHGGLGLGLAIARQLVELHGGRISVRSAGVGKGATFTVELPAATSPARPAAPLKADCAIPAEGFVPSPVLQNRRILLVEDDAPSRDVVAWLLERCGAKVVAVDSAQAALAEFERAMWAPVQGQLNRFDLIVSDIAMPEQDGYVMIRELRKLETTHDSMRVPAIALTAYAREQHRAEALKEGFQVYLAKPIDPERLIDAAVRLLGEPAGSRTQGGKQISSREFPMR